MEYLHKDYITAASTKQKMPLTYAIVHFDCDDGMMLYGISKTVNFCGGEFLGNKTWAFINDGGLKTETFEAKIKEFAKKFENKGHNVTITII
jgi:hypothetical protein